MTSEHQQMLPRLRQLVDRPMRWINVKTLQVFNVAPIEQPACYRHLKPLHGELEALAGGSITIIFSSPEQSRRQYGELIAALETQAETAINACHLE